VFLPFGFFHRRIRQIARSNRSLPVHANANARRRAARYEANFSVEVRLKASISEIRKSNSIQWDSSCRLTDRFRMERFPLFFLRDIVRVRFIKNRILLHFSRNTRMHIHNTRHSRSCTITEHVSIHPMKPKNCLGIAKGSGFNRRIESPWCLGNLVIAIKKFIHAIIRELKWRASIIKQALAEFSGFD